MREREELNVPVMLWRQEGRQGGGSVEWGGDEDHNHTGRLSVYPLLGF